MNMSKSPEDIAVQIICIVENYVLEDRLTAHKAAPLVLDMIVAAQKQTRREALEECINLVAKCLDEEYFDIVPEIRALIEKENEK